MSYYPPRHKTWHLRGEASNITGYLRLVMLPQTVETEGTVTGASSGSTETLIKAFSSDVVGVTSLAAGTWRFALRAKVSSATDTTTIKVYVYSRDADSVETELFNATSAEINNTTVGDIVITSSQAAFSVDETDRVIVKFYAVSNSASAKTVTIYYQGATNYSTVSLPEEIPVREGDMTKFVYDPDGDAILHANALQLATDYVDAVNIGQINWNEPDGTADLHLYNGATLQIGQELHFYGKASADIDNGELVMYDGAQGDHIKIKPATSTILTSPHLIVGVATQNITTGDFGYTTWFGKVNGVYTTGWATGDTLYVDNSTYQLTNTPGAVVIVVGYVVKAATGAAENGIIAVNPGFISQSGGGGGTWGSITGTLSDQTDLQAALDAKQDANKHYEILQDSAGAIMTDSAGINILYVEVT